MHTSRCKYHEIKAEFLPTFLSNPNVFSVQQKLLLLHKIYKAQGILTLFLSDRNTIKYIVHFGFRFNSLSDCDATGGENQALPPPEGEAGVHPAAGPGNAAVLRV